MAVVAKPPKVAAKVADKHPKTAARVADHAQDSATRPAKPASRAVARDGKADTGRASDVRDKVELKIEAQAEPKIKTWNGWNLDALKKEKTLRLTDTGSFYGFFMVKAIDSDPNHYINFRCASLNQYANAVFSDVVPDVPIAKMSREQLMAFRNLTEAARGGFSPRMKEIEQHFPDIKLRRAALEVETASKKLPLSLAKAVVDTINKF